MKAEMGDWGQKDVRRQKFDGTEETRGQGEV